MHNPDFLSDTPRPAAAQLIIIIIIIITSVVEDDAVRDPNEERCRLVFLAAPGPKKLLPHSRGKASGRPRYTQPDGAAS